MMLRGKHLYEFGEFSLNKTEHTLLRAERPVPLGEKARDLLLILLQRPGETLANEDLIRAAWPDAYVSLNNLHQQVRNIREALGDTAKPYRYVKSIPGRGYCFAAEVTERWLPAEVLGEAISQELRSGSPQNHPIVGAVPARALSSGRNILSPRNILIGLGVGVIFLSAFVIRQTHMTRSRPRPTIAVFDFKNSEAEASTAWLSTAFSDWFRTELMRQGQFRIIPGEDVDRAKIELSLPAVDSMSKISLSVIRKNLGADYVLLGSYVQLGDPDNAQIRVDAKLQDTMTSEVVASAAESGTKAGLFQLVSNVGGLLNAKLGIEHAAADSQQTSLPRNPEAMRLYSEGLAHLRLYDALAASQFLEDALKAEPSSGAIHSSLAEAWFTLGYQKKAIAEASKALSLEPRREGEGPIGIQARYYEMIGQWDRAVQNHQSLWTVFPDNPEHGIHTAQAQIRARKGSEALLTLAKLRQQFPRLAEDPRIDLTEAIAAESQGESQQELTAAKRAMAKGENLGARLLVARAQLRACWALDKLSRWDEALQLARTARLTFAQLGDRALEANAQMNIGDVLDDRGDHTAAIPAYQDAVALFRAIGHQEGLMSSLNNLGTTLTNLGDLDGAKTALDESFQVAVKMEDPKRQAIALDNIGNLLTRRGDLAGARGDLEKAVAVIRTVGDKDLLSAMLNDLGIVVRDQGRLNESSKMFDESKRLAEEIGNSSTAGSALGNSGELLFREGDLHGAKKLFDEEVALGNKIHDESLVASARLGLGRIHLASAEFNEARSNYEESLRLHSKLNEKGLLAEAQLARAELDLEENSNSAASDDARKAAAEFRKEKAFGQESLASAVLARALAADGHQAQASDAAAHALSLLPKVQNASHRNSVIIALASVKLVRGASAQARLDLQSALMEVASVPDQLEIRCGLCKLDQRDCTPEVEKQARDRGFTLIADKISAGRRELAKSSGRK